MSVSKNLMIDYLLTSTETPLSKIISLSQQSMMEKKQERLQHFQLDRPICLKKQKNQPV